jgi:hypothetical protein
LRFVCVSESTAKAQHTDRLVAPATKPGRIAANIAKLPELLKSLGQSSSSMALTDRVASRNSSAVAKPLGRLAIDRRDELVGPR